MMRNKPKSETRKKSCQEQVGKEPFWPENGRTVGDGDDAWTGSLRTCGHGSGNRLREVRGTVLKGLWR